MTDINYCLIQNMFPSNTIFFVKHHQILQLIVNCIIAQESDCNGQDFYWVPTKTSFKEEEIEAWKNTGFS